MNKVIYPNDLLSIKGMRNCILFVFIILTLSACGGGGSSTTQTTTNTTVVSSKTAEFDNTTVVTGAITSVSISQSLLTVEFQIVNEDGTGIINVLPDDVSFTVAKLGTSPVGNLTGNWQSYINVIEQPGVGPGTEPKLQSTSERGSSGEFVNNQNGTYTYTLAQSLEITDDEILNQAEVEGLDLRFIASNTHRVAIQVSNAAKPENLTFDWNPSTGLTEVDGVFGHEIVDTQTCNNCHGELALHGGGRIEVKYCVTCHNPGTTDANSGNTVNFKNMIHKIHRGKELPSVVAGGVYQIYGFRDSLHDYSTLGYPGDILECNQCHAGNATAEGEQIVTVSGDNWREIATQSACGSCHDELDFSQHYGGQSTDENCMSCHQNSAVAGSIENSHRNLLREASSAFMANIIAITNTLPGEFPQVQFSITNPLDNDTPYDILQDDVWTQGDGASRLMVDIGWATEDYTNTGNEGDNANAVEIDALTTAEPVGDGSFLVTSPIAIPDGSLLPNIATSGSGAVNIEGHPAVNIGDDTNPDIQRVAMTNTVDYFSVDEADGAAITRRSIVNLDNCLTCHGQLSFHGSNRTDNVETCVLCHNPRNTDKRVRDIAINPPTDGKAEESLDFKTMIHAIHAPSKREQPIQIVGFGGFSTHVYDEESVHYPGEIGNCSSCHEGNTYNLPLSEGVLATTVSTGASIADPTDDIVVSPMASVCSSCHDNAVTQTHMEQNGASFATSQQDIDDGIVLEQCSICHGEGRTYDVKVMHPTQ